VQSPHYVRYDRTVRAIVDTSSLISLAWSGQLDLIELVPLDLVVIDSVRAEAVDRGRAGGHPDASAIESALRPLSREHDPTGSTVDERVVAAARTVGMVIANDQVVGRRARNGGARWLRTGDVVLLAHRVGRIDAVRARGAIGALFEAGRITEDLRDGYLEALS